MTQRPLGASTFGIITGAASGFSRALAIELGRRGGRLLLGDINLSALEETASSHAKRGGGRDDHALRRCVKLEDDRGRSEPPPAAPSIWSSTTPASAAADWLAKFPSKPGARPSTSTCGASSTAATSLFQCCASRTRSHPQRRIGSGTLAAPRMAAYNVAKAGVVSLSETLAGELTDTKISVTVLCPTFFRTNIAADGMFEDPRIKRMAENWSTRTPVESRQKTLQAVEAGQLYRSHDRWKMAVAAQTCLAFPFRALIEMNDRMMNKALNTALPVGKASLLRLAARRNRSQQSPPPVCGRGKSSTKSHPRPLRQLASWSGS